MSVDLDKETPKLKIVLEHIIQARELYDGLNSEEKDRFNQLMEDILP